MRLLADLQTINTQLKGAFTFSPEAEEFYEAWYTADDAKLQQGEYAVQDRAFYTYCGRRPTLLRKVSMCVSAARGNKQIISLDDIQTGLRWMEEAERSMPGTFAAVGRSALASQVASVKQILSQRGQIYKSAFLRLMSQDMSVDDLDGVERTLSASKELEVIQDTDRGDTLYKWVMQ